MFPENLMQACFQQVQTYYKPKPPAKLYRLATSTISPLNDSSSLDEYDVTTIAVALAMDALTNGSEANRSDVTTATPLVPMVRAVRYTDGMNVLGQSEQTL